jgi:hypothetical protein
MRYLAALLLLIPHMLFAAQSVVLPNGPTNFSFGVNNNVKSIGVQINRTQWTSPTQLMDYTVTYTGTFKGVLQTIKGCGGTGLRGGIANKPTQFLTCSVPPGTSRTVNVTVTVSGGPITIGVDPSFSTRE